MHEPSLRSTVPQKEINMASTSQLLIVAVAAVLFSVTSATGRRNTFTSKCSVSERSYLFNECLSSFGWAHWSSRVAMQKSSSCLTEKLNCSAAVKTVDCINNIPATALNGNCWDGLKDTMSFMLLHFHFGCTYYDIERHCWGRTGSSRIPELVSKSAYTRRGRRAATWARRTVRL